MKKPAQHLIAEVPRRQARVEMTIGIDLGDVWSHYCTLNQDGEVVSIRCCVSLRLMKLKAEVETRIFEAVPDLFFQCLKVLAKVLRIAYPCSRMPWVATDAPRINRLRAFAVMAWKRSSVRSRSGPPNYPFQNQQLADDV
jgi:hypothetical protein